MNLDRQEPPRMVFPFLISFENEALPEGIEGGKKAFMKAISFQGLEATGKQRNRYLQRSVCAFQSTASKTTPGGQPRKVWTGD